MRHLIPGSLLIVSFITTLSAAEPARSTGPWDVERILNTTPEIKLGETQGLVTELRYRTEPFRGRETWVFAYYGRPAGQGPAPAMLLVHGGGGKAFGQWAELWAQRGYAALAMDLAGHGPDGMPLANGGPPQDDGSKFRAIIDEPIQDNWPYQAVAAVLRGHAVLASRTGEVDPERIGVTGISWGGYLTCILAGIDHKLKVAVPVYGCGFLGENSHWLEVGTFEYLPPAARERWLKTFDPSCYLAGTRCPTLWVNGTNDFAYPMDSYRKSYRLVTNPQPTLCVTVNMPHGHEQGWEPKEIGAFVDSVLKGGEPLVRLSPIKLDSSRASATWQAASPPAKADFHYTNDTARWQHRAWTTLPAAIDSQASTIAVKVPAERPLAGFFTVKDQRGLVVSTDYAELDPE